MYSVLRTCVRPPQIDRLPLNVPESRLNGATPSERGNLTMAKSPQLRQLGEEDGAQGRTDTAYAFEKAREIGMVLRDLLLKLRLPALELIFNRFDQLLDRSPGG
jgi:hypothetical protein